MEKNLEFLGYPKHTVTSSGKVYSLEYAQTKFKKELKYIHDKNGYLVVHLCYKNKAKKWRVHRLVAIAFISTSDTSLTVDHIDNNKQNNTVDNLQWMTSEENLEKSFKSGRKHFTIPILVYKNDIFLSEEQSIKEAAKKYKVFESTIRRQIKGKIKKPRSFIFKRAFKIR